MENKRFLEPFLLEELEIILRTEEVTGLARVFERTASGGCEVARSM